MSLVSACGESDGDVGLFTAGQTGSADATSDDGVSTGSSDSASGDASSSAGTSDSADSTSTGPILDVGGQTGTAEGGADDGCDKVDFLFVIDNSGSMQDEQANLIASFPLFIQTIEDTLVDAQDYHIMAVGTDNGQGTGLSSTCTNGVCTCTPAPVCCVNACSGGFATSCNGFPCDSLPITACDTEYGTGKMYDADGTYCELEGDQRYMTQTQPDIAGTFQCIANVGTYGSGEERPMQAMLAAASDANNTAGGCNEGFLRDDAILVVVFITDEEDDGTDGSVGDPSAWFADLVALKNGDETAIVMMGLYGDAFLGGLCPVGSDPGNGDPGAEDGMRLHEFTTMFEHGIPGSVCGTSADYSDYFTDAVAVIDTTCSDFNPPG
jgi:hypothetical protein